MCILELREVGPHKDPPAPLGSGLAGTEIKDGGQSHDDDDDDDDEEDEHDGDGDDDDNDDDDDDDDGEGDFN